MSSEEFLNECVTNKTGKNAGKHSIWFNGNKTNKETGIKETDILRLKKEDFKVEKDYYKTHLKIGMPMGLQFSVTAVGIIIVQSAVNVFGSDVIASYTASSKILQLVMQPLVSFGVTIATYAGQNLGAQNYERIKYGMKIMKSLEVAVDYNQQIFKAEFVYFRDFSDLYKMKPTTYMTDKERFYRLLNGIPEEEFPIDTLDNIIYHCISSKYQIVNTRSKLMISTSELRNLQQYKNRIHKKSNIFIEPDQILPMLDGMYIPHIGIDIFPYLPIAADIFSDISITYTIPIANWIECYSKIIADIKTLHNIEEFLQ